MGLEVVVRCCLDIFPSVRAAASQRSAADNFLPTVYARNVSSCRCLNPPAPGSTLSSLAVDGLELDIATSNTVSMVISRLVKVGTMKTHKIRVAFGGMRPG
jgi:hypothetical protein